MITAATIFPENPFRSFREKLADYRSSRGLEPVCFSDQFLYWLIGFAEGDGCFFVNNRNEFSFILVQGAANLGLLQAIHGQLGLGHILKQGERVYRLIVQKVKEVELILWLFNGNIVLPSRKIQFGEFFRAFIAKRPQVGLVYRNRNNFPSLETAWLLGFTEAEGCFTISLLSNSLAFRTRFIVSQKGAMNLPVLSHCIQLFQGGSIEGHSQKDNYSYVISGLKNIPKIYGYFDKYLGCFLGIKKLAYLKFKALNDELARREHLDPVARVRLVALAAEINGIGRKFK